MSCCVFLGPKSVQLSSSMSPSSKRRKNTKRQTESSKSPSESEFITQTYESGKKRIRDRKPRRRSTSPVRNRISKRSRGPGRKRHTVSDLRSSSRVAPLPSPEKHSNTECVIAPCLCYARQLIIFALTRRGSEDCSIDDFSVSCTLGKVSVHACLIIVAYALKTPQQGFLGRVRLAQFKVGSDKMCALTCLACE